MYLFLGFILFKKLITRCIKITWALVATIVVSLAVIVSLLKYALPYADNYRADLESLIHKEFNAQVTIGSFHTSWNNTGPELVFDDLAVIPSKTTPLDLTVKEARLHINFWASLFQQKLVTNSFLLDGIRAKINSSVFFKIRPNSQGNQLFENLSHLLLSQVQQFEVVDSFIIVRHSNGRIQDYQIDNLKWHNQGNHHRGEGELYVDGFSNNSLSVIVDLYGQRRENIFGQFYAEANQMDISPWLTQLIGEHVELESTQANFQAWSEIKNGLVENTVIDVSDTGLSWLYQDNERFIKIEQAQFTWLKTEDYWTLFTNDVQLNTLQGLPETFEFSLLTYPEYSQLNIGQADISSVTELLTLFNNTKQLDFVSGLKIEGFVEQLKLRWGNNLPLAATFNLSNVSFLPEQKPNKASFGVKNLNLNGVWLDEKGWIELSGKNGEFATADMFTKPFRYDDLQIASFIQLIGDDVIVQVPKVHLGNKELDINLAAEFSYFTQYNQSDLSVYGEVKGPEQSYIKSYLPKYVVPTKTYNFLNRAIEKGKGELTQIAITGNPSFIPFSPNKGNHKKGQFWLKSQLKDGAFSFNKGWPTLISMDADLVVTNNVMTIFSKQGQLDSLTITDDITAQIVLDSPSTVLNLHIDTDSLPLTNFHHFIEHTPLQTKLGDAFKFVKLAGTASGHVDIQIPLSTRLNEQGEVPQQTILGSMSTTAADMSLPRLSLELTKVNSKVNFTGERFSVAIDSAKLYDLPISLSIEGKQLEDTYKINADVFADWNTSELKKLYTWPVLEHINGDLDTALKIAVELSKGKYQYVVTGQSDLTNANYTLPGNTNKNIGKYGVLDIHVTGNSDNNLIDFNWDNQLYFSGIAPTKDAVISKAHLSIGSDEFQMPSQGFDISINLSELEFESSLRLVTDIIYSLPKKTDGQNTTFLSSPFAINGTVQELDMLGQSWQNVNLHAEPQDDHWLFSLGAKQTLTEIKVFNDIENKGIEINAEFMQLYSPPEKEEQDKTSFTSSVNNSAALIKTLPTIRAICKTCSFDDKPLGKVELITKTEDNQLIIERANMRLDDNKVELTGRWLGDDKGGQTQLKGAVDSNDFGKWLGKLGLDTGIKDSEAKINLDLYWTGAPYEFNYATLNGDTSFKLDEGSLSEISDKGARIFSLFSLDSLYRKLKLDFSDVFSKGLFYNDIKGDIRLENGVGHTQNIKMDGVAGDMSMEGYTDLATNTLDYNVQFKPKVTSSLGVLSWLAYADPITFIGALALDKIIEEADVVSEIKIKVSGSLDDPKVEEVKRFTRKVKVPRSEIAPKQQIPPNVEEKDPKTTEG